MFQPLCYVILQLSWSRNRIRDQLLFEEKIKGATCSKFICIATCKVRDSYQYARLKTSMGLKSLRCRLSRGQTLIVWKLFIYYSLNLTLWNSESFQNVLPYRWKKRRGTFFSCSSPALNNISTNVNKYVKVDKRIFGFVTFSSVNWSISIIAQSNPASLYSGLRWTMGARLNQKIVNFLSLD